MSRYIGVRKTWKLLQLGYIGTTTRIHSFIRMQNVQVHWSYIGVMEKKMESTTMGYIRTTTRIHAFIRMQNVQVVIGKGGILGYIGIYWDKGKEDGNYMKLRFRV